MECGGCSEVNSVGWRFLFAVQRSSRVAKTDPNLPLTRSRRSGNRLKVGAIGDPPILAGVSPLLGEWEASRKGSVSILQVPVTPESFSTADVLLFPAQRLGDLVDAGTLAIIPNAIVLPPKPSESELDEQSRREPGQAAEKPDDPFQYLDIAPGYREQVSRYGSDRLALPCGGSALVLVYHRDAFEREPNRVAAPGGTGVETAGTLDPA